MRAHAACLRSCALWHSVKPIACSHGSWWPGLLRCTEACAVGCLQEAQGDSARALLVHSRAFLQALWLCGGVLGAIAALVMCCGGCGPYTLHVSSDWAE